MKKIGYILLLFFHFKGYAQSTTLLSWDFNSLTGAEATVHATTLANAMDGGIISRGAGITATVLNNSFHSSGWTTTATLSDAIANEDYYQWTAQIKSGSVVSFQTLLANFRRSASGPDHFQWRYSLNGVDFFNAGPEIIFTSTTTNGLAQPPIDLSTIPSLQQLNATMQVCFRLYGYNATGSTGTFSIGRLTGDDLTVMGIPFVSLPHWLGELQWKKVQDSIQLSWTLQFQGENIQCWVERSYDGRNFEIIKAIAISEGVALYQIKDYPIGSLAYYRVRVVEPGTQDHFSRIVVFRNAAINTPKVYPNPATNHIQIEATDEIPRGPVKLLNALGSVVRMVHIDHYPALVDLTGLPSGVYHLIWDHAPIKTFVKK